MKGEFKGDFSRDTYDPGKHFLRVLMQQGRVSLDADWNEQVDILLHYMQTLAKDILGPFAGPANDLGFKITPLSNSGSTLSFNIGCGRYYVDGMLCENELEASCKPKENDQDQGIEYYYQSGYPISDESSIPPLSKDDLPFLVYLDVWERHITSVEDDYIREKALGGPDTASRSKVVWQVKVKEKMDTIDCKKIRDSWPNFENQLQPLYRGCLMAHATKPANETNPCITSPEARYRGEENQLYRVEIHRGGNALKKSESEKDLAATFKWSRDNGSVIFPIISKDGLEIFLEHLGKDSRSSLKVDDWVEIIDDSYTLLALSRPSPQLARPLSQVESVDLTEMKVILKDNTKPNASQESILNITYTKDSTNHPMLRRWDHEESDPTERDRPELAEDGALFVEEDKWLTLEDGVQIRFLPSPNQDKVYQAGDYWLIPARTAIGDVDWPKDDDALPKALPPHGIDHHYAPLAVLKGGTPIDCRCTIIVPNSCNPLMQHPNAKKSSRAKGIEE